MKVTVDVPDDLYRQVKAKSALKGWSVREVTTSLFQSWVARPLSDSAKEGASESRSKKGDPPWFALLRTHARQAQGRHDMESVRRSIRNGRARESHP